jgi:hypothetical protein
MSSPKNRAWLQGHFRHWSSRILPFLLGLCLIATLSTKPMAQVVLPPTPFYLNEMQSLCTINHCGRVMLRYDVRALGAAKLLIQIYKADEKSDKPYREFLYEKPAQHIRLNLSGVPIGLYQVKGTPLDAAGKPLSGGERPMTLAYGAERAWKAYYDAINARTGRIDPPFSESVANATADQPSLEIDPQALVLNPGKSSPMKARLRNAPADVVLEWKLEGRGRLTVIDNTRAEYFSEAKFEPSRAGREAVIHVTAVGHPELQANVWVVVTRSNIEEGK